MNNDQPPASIPGPHASQPPDLRALPPRGNDTVVLRPWQADDLPTVAQASTDPNHAQSPGGSAIDPGLATWG